MDNVTWLYKDKTDLSNESKFRLIEQYAKELWERCSWTQLSDSGLSTSKQLEWQNYRDDLLSIQDDFTNPDDVVFPIQPMEE